MHSHPSGEQSGGLPGFLRTDSIEYLCGTGEGALAKISVGIGSAALILTAATGTAPGHRPPPFPGPLHARSADLRRARGEMRVMRTEMLAMRTEMRAEIQAVRAEARADREALRAEARADRETFERHITRLTERQGILSGHVESIRNHLATTQGKPRP